MERLLQPSMVLLDAFKKQFVLVIGLAALTAASLHADAKFGGSTGYQVLNGGTQILMRADHIQNPSSENATGTLLVKVWAFDAPYSGSGAINGTLLGSYKLAGLGPGQHYDAFNQTVAMTAPPASRSYIICLTLSEYRKDAYYTVDHRNMPQPASLGPVKMFKLDGPWTWQTSYEGGTIDISVAKISHHRATKTGSLHLEVWATPQPFQGGALNGFRIGTVSKKALEAGMVYNNVQNTEKFIPPPNGTYFVNLVLSEYDGSKYVIRDYLGASKASVFAGRK